MTGSEEKPRFPQSFGADVTVRDIDLDEEEFIVGGRRLTEKRAAELADAAQRGAGRPSLSGRKERSPQLGVRVSPELAQRVRRKAEAEGKRPSDIIREALERFV